MSTATRTNDVCSDNRKQAKTRFAVLNVALVAVSLHAPHCWADALEEPTGAQRFSVVSPGGIHGQASVWTAADGSRVAQEHILLRGQVWDLREVTTPGSNGIPLAVQVKGVSPRGSVDERFSVSSGRATWKSALDSGNIPYRGPAFYVAADGVRSGNLPMLLETLVSTPAHSMKLLPAGEAHAERFTEISLEQGGKRKKVVGWLISGLGLEPLPLWATPDGKFFGSIGPTSLLPVGEESALQQLQTAEDNALAARSAALALKFLSEPEPASIAFTNVRAFVNEHHWAEHQTIVVSHGVIEKVGPRESTSVPQGARIIDGAGMTLVPGLWDSHQHVHDDASGPLLLSLGITSVRDCGNVVSLTLARAARHASGKLLSPTVYPSLMIDGKGAYSSQSAVIVTSQREAIEAVDKGKEDGFTGVKIYGSLTPSWVAPVAAEAHRLGLHVHGHLPAGMRPREAIDAGYDEINHIYFITMEAMPDSVVKTSNGISRIDGTGRYARDVSLDADPIKSLIATMAARHITVDPTLVVAESVFVAEPGTLSPAFAPFAETVPTLTEREFHQGGFAVPKDLTRGAYRQSFAKLSSLVSMMHKAGIRIVAGTDGSGMELVRELELYVDAGFTTAEALEAATIEPARNLGVSKHTGSIEVGKIADLVLVEGDPSSRIGDLRHTRWVMLGGRLLDADALRRVSGFTGRPK